VDTNVLEEITAFISRGECQSGMWARRLRLYGIIMHHNKQGHHLNIHCHEILKAQYIITLTFEKSEYVCFAKQNYNLCESVHCHHGTAHFPVADGNDDILGWRLASCNVIEYSVMHRQGGPRGLDWGSILGGTSILRFTSVRRHSVKGGATKNCNVIEYSVLLNISISTMAQS
jgi:hypothetical protein